MNLNQWFEKGLTQEQYIAQHENHADNFNHILNNFLLPNDEEFFTSLKNQKLRAIVIGEVWCGHCMLNIPILLNVANKANMPVRFLNRDENLELMDQYLTNGNRTIPIFIFIDESGNEIAKWGPMAETTRTFVAPLREKMPPKDDESYDEQFKEMIKQTTKAFTENNEIWLGVYNSLKDTLN